MSDSNPFHIVFVITAIIIFIGVITSVVAPTFGVSVPTAPGFPTLHTPTAIDQNNNVAPATPRGYGINRVPGPNPVNPYRATNSDIFSFIWAYLVFGAEIIGYFITFVGYMILMVGVFFTLISGIAPGIADTISVLVFILFIGSILMFIRGSSGGGSK